MNQFRTLFGFNTQLIYYLRQNPLNEIIPADQNMGGIFLGNIYAAYSMEILKKHNITAVLTVAAGTNLKYTPEQDIAHQIIMADDIDHYNLSRHFERMSDFIHKCRKEKRNILVHCFAGISRSTTSIVAYLMREMGYTHKKGISLCRSKRKEINPNNGFVRQLAAYERKLQSQKENSNGTQQNGIYPSINGKGITNQKWGQIQSQTPNQTTTKQPNSIFSQTASNANNRNRNIVMNGKKIQFNNQQNNNITKSPYFQNKKSSYGNLYGTNNQDNNKKPYGLMGQQYQVYQQQQQQNKIQNPTTVTHNANSTGNNGYGFRITKQKNNHYKTNQNYQNPNAQSLNINGTNNLNNNNNQGYSYQYKPQYANKK